MCIGSMAVMCVIYFLCLYMAVNPGRWTRSCTSCLMMLSFLSLTIGGGTEVTDFVSVNILPDGEIETRIHYNGISAKETRVSNRDEHGLKFRQLTDGRRFIQLIYENETLKDCEFVRQKGPATTFLKSFKNDLRNLIPTSNITVEILDGKPLPDDINSWLNYKRLRKMCKRVHRRVRKQMKSERKRKKKKEESRRMPLVLDEDGDEEEEDEENNASRNKRGIDDFFRIPGTMWCGKGYSASKYTDLGPFAETDKCCRTHDKACPFWIGGLQTKYGLHNIRLNTLMHCHCDERFRACLKMVATTEANIVGKIFFNVVQTKCFVLKRTKVCRRKVRWSKKCLKKKVITKAILRDNIPY